MTKLDVQGLGFRVCSNAETTVIVAQMISDSLYILAESVTA